LLHAFPGVELLLPALAAIVLGLLVAVAIVVRSR
jgi:hypothetical protein